MVDWENAEKVLDAIDAEPERFDMASWCGTTRCVAGWAAHLAGRTLADRDAYTSSVWATKGAKNARIPEIAAEYLGISYDLAIRNLFSVVSFSTTHPSTDDIRAQLKSIDEVNSDY